MSEDRVASYLTKLDGPVSPEAGFAESLLEDLLDELGTSQPSTTRRVASRVIRGGRTRARVLSRVVAAAAIFVVFATSLVFLRRSIWHGPGARRISAATISQVQPAWTVRTEDPILAPPTVSGGVVYAVGLLNVYAREARSGQMLWTVRRDAHGTGGDPAASELVGNTLVVGTGNYVDWPPRRRPGAAFGIDASTGQVRWRRALPGPAAVASGSIPGDLAFAVTLDTGLGRGQLFALDASTGATVWSHRVHPTQNPPVLDGGRVLVSSRDGIRAFDGATGHLLWYTPMDQPGGPVIGRNAIYTNAADGSIHAIVRTTGRPLWKVGPRFGSRSYLGWGSPGVDGNTVFAPRPDLRIEALDAYDGHRLWTSGRLPMAGFGGAWVDAESGVLFVGGSAGGLLALDPSDHARVLWSLAGNFGGSVTVSGPAIYVTASDGSISAFRLPG
jgi:outer membrane protein assembly factor BamB